MRILIGILGLALVATVLWDAFETIILPRRVTRRFRLARAFYRYTWKPWRNLVRRVRSPKRRDALLSFYGPLSMLCLFVVWAAALILGFGMIYWGAGSALHAFENPGFATDLYLSGTTFFTLGIGDVIPRTHFSRLIVVVEAGMGFGFLAIVISYLPVLYGAFSRREVNISLLDARAGSPPTAAELLRRHAQLRDPEALREYMRDWEVWAAELMESHLSYPVLCYFRSQHNNQSWLAALTTVLDVCALLVASADEGALLWQAQLTFAIARHALVDLAQVFAIPPSPPHDDRLPEGSSVRLIEVLKAAGVAHCGLRIADEKLRELRHMYEPYANGLANRLLMPLPLWVAEKATVDNWRTSAWERASAPVAIAPEQAPVDDDHF